MGELLIVLGVLLIAAGIVGLVRRKRPKPEGEQTEP